jgi:hypothetical protein
MSQKPPTSSSAIDDITDEVYKQVNKYTPDGVVEAIAIQIYTAREARGRIDKEGSVVRDVRGSVIAHPALKVESDAIKLYTALLAKHRK